MRTVAGHRGSDDPPATGRIARRSPAVTASSRTSGTGIPEPTVTRLATYLHVLRSFSQRGVLIASSGELASAAGVNPAILRKDLSYVAANGVRGVGYDVGRLTARISMTLHTDSVHTVALAGAGHLGRALLAHTGFGRGFRVAAMFDADPDLVGTTPVPGGPVVEPLDTIVATCADVVPAVETAVIATADEDARRAFDAFVAAGVRQVLNVTPVTLSAESDVVVRQVDLALELQVLAFAASRASAQGARDELDAAARDVEPASRSVAGRVLGKQGLGKQNLEKQGFEKTGFENEQDLETQGHQGNAMGEETVTA